MSMMSSLATFLWMVQATGPSGLMAFAPLLIIMVIFYVLLILPAQRRQKKTQVMLGALKIGDKVVTRGGLFATIVGLDGDTVRLHIPNQLKVKEMWTEGSALLPE